MGAITGSGWRRWALVASLAIGMAGPAAAETVLKVLLDGEVKTLDPIFTTESMAQQHGYMIYDQLFGLDAKRTPQPQMVGSYDKSADGLTWHFVLRDGLKFHDGTPVEAKDVVASWKRWAARSPGGGALMAVTQSLDATGAKTVELKLKEPFGPVLEVLATPVSSLQIMREQDAETDPFKAVTTAIGSGPFKFVSEGWNPGDVAVYVKNEDYVPRDEPADGYAGGKRVYVDRVEYGYIPDATTAAQALISGEVDFLTFPQLALMPLFERAPDVKIQVLDPVGEGAILRMNQLIPPFDNPKARQALLYLVGNQQDYLSAIVKDKKLQRPCWAPFGCGTPLESTAGIGDWAKSGPDVAKAKELLAEAGYDGRPIVLIDPPGSDRLHAMTLVTAQRLREAGVNVDLQAMDLGTWASRRATKADPKDDPAGWHIFHTHGKMAAQGDPLASTPAPTPCTGKNWHGWPCDEELEQIRLDYARTPPEGRKAWIEKYQTRFLQVLPYIPLGQFQFPVVYRADLSGVLTVPGYPAMWNIKKSD
jgi:peptide/nickel transport system substrate-binding protein